MSLEVNPSAASQFRLQLFVERVANCRNAVLQYHRDTDKLRPWKWPSKEDSVDELRARITPSDLREYRISHRMLGPCCLCPMIDINQPDFVEAAMYMPSTGPFAGQYIATCARDQCGYFVFLERLYDKIGVPIKTYDIREPGERIPPCVTHRLEDIPVPRPLKRTYAMLDINMGLVSKRPPKRPMRQSNTSTFLERLDARRLPGITIPEFQALFTRCECGLVTTRRAFNMHRCRTEPEVIDLTEDNE